MSHSLRPGTRSVVGQYTLAAASGPRQGLFRAQLFIVALAVLGIWVAGALAAGAVVVRRRDA